MVQQGPGHMKPDEPGAAGDQESVMAYFSGVIRYSHIEKIVKSILNYTLTR
jgi:hypothetical protein